MLIKICKSAAHGSVIPLFTVQTCSIDVLIELLTRIQISVFTNMLNYSFKNYGSHIVAFHTIPLDPNPYLQMPTPTSRSHYSSDEDMIPHQLPT